MIREPQSTPLSHKYLIALNLEARRAREPVDLAEVVRASFGGSRVRVIERGFKGRSGTVEMMDTLVIARPGRISLRNRPPAPSKT